MSTVVRTMCPMNCHPTLCGMLVEIEDGRVLSVKGDPDNPDSQGFLCIRGQASREIIGNPERLLHPMVRNRRGGDWRRASWAEVLDRIAERMREADRLAVATWTGHGVAANNYGMRLTGNLVRRFANLYGCQTWGSQMICWGLGGFGLGLTGVLETSTKEDMGAHANLIVLWGANLASQPNTARHVAAARRRGAHVVTVDVRETEAAAQSDEVFVLRPGTDAALALAMMHVIVREDLHDRAFVERHALGFDELAAHVRAHSPAWAEAITGISAASGKVEFVSERAKRHGLPALPVYEPLPSSPYPLEFRQGRTLTHFHGFYDHGRALPSLARADAEPVLWISPVDAAARGVADGAAIRIHNERGALEARARVTDKVPAGTVWMRDGWRGVNNLTSGAPSIPDEACELFPFTAGQSAYDARVEVSPEPLG